MKKSLLYLAAFAGLTACVQDLKEDVVLNPAENNGLALTINAKMDEPQTRVVTEDGLAFKFAEGENIGVYFYHPTLAAKPVANVKFAAKAAAEEGKVKFVLPEDQYLFASTVSALLTQEGTMVYSYAPYKLADGSVDGNVGDGAVELTKSGADVKVTRNFTLPANQNTANVVTSVAENYVVVAKPVSPEGDNDGKYKADLNYSGIYSLATFKIINNTNRSLKVTGFKYTVGEGEALTGKFTADLAADPKFPVGEETDKYTLTPVEDETKNYVEVDLSAAPVTLAAGDELPLYVVVNSGNYTNGSKIEVMANPTDDNLVSYVYSKESKAVREFPRNERQNFNVSIGAYDCEIKVTEDGKDKVEFINNVDDLKALQKAVNEDGETMVGKTYVLTANLDLAGIEWQPIGNVKSYPSCTFAGTFDGNGKTISHLTASASGDEGVASAGLFGSITGVVKNLTLENVNIESTHYAGAIVGYCGVVYEENQLMIENCHVINGTITSTPELVNGAYDNGGEAGAIAGYVAKLNKVEGCTVQGVTVKAYRDLGGIVGFANNESTVKDCKVENVTLIVDGFNNYNYKGYTISTEHDAGAYVGEKHNGANVTNNEEDVDVTVKVIGYPIEAEKAYYRVLTDAMEASESNIKLLVAGEYALGTVKTNTLNIKGTDAVNAKLTFTKADNMNGADVTFENLFITSVNENYYGMQHAGNINYNNCIIENQIYCYNEGEAKSTFTKCTFIQTSKDWYNVWTYASNVDFINCNFYSAGKAALVYAEAGGWKTVKFNTCNFSATAKVAGKAAIEIDSSLRPYNVYIDNCNARGFDAGSMSGNTLYNLKKGFYGENCHIYLDGTRLVTAYKDAMYYFVPAQEWLSVDTPVRYVAYCIDENDAKNNVYRDMTEENGVYSCEIPGVCEKVQFFITSTDNATNDINSAMKKTAELKISRNAGVAKYNATSGIWE